MRNAARDHLHIGVVAFELDLHVRDRGLISIGEQLFEQHELRILAHFSIGVANGRGDATDLGELHLAVGIAIHIDLGNGIQHTLATA